jgi:hypothetical protein
MAADLGRHGQAPDGAGQVPIRVAERIVAADPEVDMNRFPRLKPRLQAFWASAASFEATPA